MAVVETEIQGQIMQITLNRPERMNALGVALRTEMAEAFTEFRDNRDLEVAVFTGTGRAFCAGEDMKEALERGAPGSAELSDAGTGVHSRYGRSRLVGSLGAGYRVGHRGAGE